MLPTVGFVGLRSARIGSHRIQGYMLAQLLTNEGHEVLINPKHSARCDILVVAEGGKAPRITYRSGNVPLVGVVSRIPEQVTPGYFRTIDFVITGSLEGSYSLASGNIPQTIAPLVEPNLPARKATWSSRRLTIRYHGNREHLAQLPKEQKKAFLRLSEKYDFCL